ncbi:hypothetical protein U1Q18_004103 [Sarracenia purpurea var. burkii]
MSMIQSHRLLWFRATKYLTPNHSSPLSNLSSMAMVSDLRRKSRVTASHSEGQRYVGRNQIWPLARKAAPLVLVVDRRFQEAAEVAHIVRRGAPRVCAQQEDKEQWCFRRVLFAWWTRWSQAVQRTDSSALQITGTAEKKKVSGDGRGFPARGSND